MGRSEWFGMDIKTLFKAYFVLESLFLKRYIWHESDGTVILNLGYSIVKYSKVLSTKELKKLEHSWDGGPEVVGWQTRPLQKRKSVWIFEDVILHVGSKYELIYHSRYTRHLKRKVFISKESLLGDST